MANTSGRRSPAAFSMDTAARVTPRALASAATSGSEMKFSTSPPNLASTPLLMPAMAILVSVTMEQPPFRASTPLAAAPGENTRLSA